jgi:hypothetical protein
MLSIMKSMRPAITSCRAGAVPRNGTWSSSTPAICPIITAARWPDDAKPALA